MTTKAELKTELRFPVGEDAALEIADELRARARNLERYPFESATMAEAGRLAANELRQVALMIGKA